ncbi:unnamed protein product [Effrenium voratum]|uniref:WW domain-containing protein n=1 Tax=Effrenium voratum TaxID=2562239 RepID=A0AA36MME3_9DINO|nr:unnamed protein product [Effrenium voratum]
MRSRIESRGAAHKSLHPSRELKAILQRHWQSHQAASEDELQVFDAQVAIDVETHVVEKALQVSTALRRLGWAPRLRRLTSADPEADEWVFFPQVDDRPSFFWNRRTDQSVWQKPPVEPAWLGFPAEDRAFFRLG